MQGLRRRPRLFMLHSWRLTLPLWLSGVYYNLACVWWYRRNQSNSARQTRVHQISSAACTSALTCKRQWLVQLVLVLHLVTADEMPSTLQEWQKSISQVKCFKSTSHFLHSLIFLWDAYSVYWPYLLFALCSFLIVLFVIELTGSNSQLHPLDIVARSDL